MTFTAGQVLTAAQLNALDITSLTVDTDTLVVDATNDRVGINTASPSVALDVGGSVVIDDDLTVDTSTLKVDSTNNRVGIGTTSPGAQLEITNTGSGQLYATGDGFYIDQSASQLDTLFLRSQGPVDISSDFDGGTTNDYIRFLTDNSTERMRITQDGNVGIGTTSPQTPLHVTRSANSEVLRLQNSNSQDQGPYISLWDLDSRVGYVGFPNNDDLYLKNETSSGLLYLATNNTIRLAIEAGGQVGIGTTGPTETFDVNGIARIRSTIKLGPNQIVLSQVDSDGSMRVQGASGYIDVGPKNSAYCHIYTDLGSFYFNKNINLAGTTSNEGGEMILQNATSYTLDWKLDNYQNQFRIFNSSLASGDFRVLYLNTTTGNNTLRWTSSGQILRYTSLTERKTDIESIDGILGYLNERNPLYDLSPKLFHEKDQPNADGDADNTTRGEYIYGMLAEDVYEVLPELCNTDGRGKLNGFAIESLIPLLVAEVQRLGGMVETLYGVHDSSYVSPVPRPTERADDEKRIFEAAIPGERAEYNDLRDYIISKYDGVEGREGITMPAELPPLEDT